MLVSLFSDASHCHETRVAAWAAWAKSERGQVSHAAPFLDRIKQTHQAELGSIVNGVFLVVSRGVALPGDEILVQNDCMRALQLLRGGPKTAKATARDYHMLSMLKKFTTDNELLIRCKHIRAHAGTGTPGYYVHDLVDKMARSNMRHERARIRRT